MRKHLPQGPHALPGASHGRTKERRKMKFKYPRFQKKLRARTTLICALALMAALGVTGSAQAVVRPSASSHAASTTAGNDGVTPDATCAAITDYHNGRPLFSFVPGNGNYNLYFDNSGSATAFCARTDSSGNTQIYNSDNSGRCLAVNSSAGTIWEGSATACANRASYTEWLAIPNEETEEGHPVYLLLNEYTFPNGLRYCMYDNTQRPAIYAACSNTNEFEWMIWPSLG